MDAKHLIGVFNGEEPLVQAFRRIREEGIEMEDIFTPFPVHEILEHHGRKSKMTHAAWFYGFFAALSVLAFLFYTAVIDWPLNYGGKPSNAFPSFLVITIILTIFSVTILSLFTFSVRAGLWPNNEKPIFHERATDDMFVIVFNLEKIDEAKTTSLLKELGAVEITEK